jgi:hypothetical protein
MPHLRQRTTGERLAEGKCGNIIDISAIAMFISS